MLRPQDNAVRERKNLDGLWDFTLDPQGEGRAAGWFRGPLPNARAMAGPLPPPAPACIMQKKSDRGKIR